MSQAAQILSVGGKRPVTKESGARENTALSNTLKLTVAPLSPKTVTPNRLAGGHPSKASPASVSFRTPDMQHKRRPMGSSSGVVSSTISLSGGKSATNESNAVSSLNSEMDHAGDGFSPHETIGQRVRGGGPTTPVATLKSKDNHLDGGESSGKTKVSSVTPQAYRGSTMSATPVHSASDMAQQNKRDVGSTQTKATGIPHKTRLSASPPTLPSSALHAPLPSPSTPAMRGFVEELMREEASGSFTDERCVQQQDEGTNLKEDNNLVQGVSGRRFFPEGTVQNGDTSNKACNDEEVPKKGGVENDPPLSIAESVAKAVASSPNQSTSKSSKRGVVSRRGGRCGPSSPVRFCSPSVVPGTIGGAPPSPIRSSSSKKKAPIAGSVQGLPGSGDDSKPSPIASTRTAEHPQPRHRPPPPIGLQPRITSVGLSSSCDGTEPSLCSSSSGGGQSASSPSSLIGDHGQHCSPETALRRKRGRSAVGATIVPAPHQEGSGHPGTEGGGLTKSAVGSDVGEKAVSVENDQKNRDIVGLRKRKPYSVTCDASSETTTSPLESSHQGETSVSTSDGVKRKKSKGSKEMNKPAYDKEARSPSPDETDKTARVAISGTDRNVTFSPPPPSPSSSLFEKHKKTPNRSPMPGQLFHNLPSFHDAVLNSPLGIILSPYSPCGGLGAFERHSSSRVASSQSGKDNADAIPSNATTGEKGTNNDATDPKTSSKLAGESSSGEAVLLCPSPRPSPKLRERGGGVTPTNFANDFVFSWLHSPTGQGLFSPGGLASATNTPRGMYGFSSYGTGRPRTPRTPTSMLLADMAGFPRESEFLSPKPPSSVPVGSGARTDENGRREGDETDTAAHQPMICISPLASTKRATGSAPSSNLKLQRKDPNTPINFHTVFESPRISSSNRANEVGNGSAKTPIPCSLPLLGDEVPSSTVKSTIQRDDPVLAERDVMEDEDLNVLLDLASTSTPKGSGTDRNAGRNAASNTSALRRRKSEGSSGTVFRSPRSQNEHFQKSHRTYGDAENPPSSLQIPMMGGRSGRSSPPKQLSRKADFQKDGPEFGRFNPPNISIRPTSSKAGRTTPPSIKKSSAGAKKVQAKKIKTIGKAGKGPIKHTVPNSQKKGAQAEVNKTNAGSKQHESYQSHGNQAAQPIGVPSSHPPPRPGSNSYSSGPSIQESSHYGMPRPPSPLRRQGSSTDTTPSDVTAYGTGGPHRPPPPPPSGMPPAAPHPPHGHYQHRHPPPHMPPHRHVPQHPSQHPSQHPPHPYHMHSGPGNHLPPYPMPHHPPPPHPLTMYGHHPAKDSQTGKGVSLKANNQKKSAKARSSKAGTKRPSDGDVKGGIAAGGKKSKKAGKGGKRPKTAAATAAAAAAAHNPVDRQKAAAAIAAVNAASGGKNDKAAALAAAILRGVTMRPSGKWQAQLYYAGKSRYIGVFDTREKAALAYEIAREVLKSDNKSPADQSAQSLKATENAVNAARKAAFEGVNEKDPRLSST